MLLKINDDVAKTYAKRQMQYANSDAKKQRQNIKKMLQIKTQRQYAKKL